jgi:uncharacterized protein (DUF3084 family)
VVISNKDNIIKEKKSIIEKIEQSMQEKDNKTIELENAIKDKEGIISAKDNIIKEKENIIEKIEQAIKEREKRIIDIEREGKKQDEKIEFLENIIQMKEDLFKKIIFHMDKTIASNDKELELKELKISELNNVILDKDEELYRKAKEIQSIYNSKSYRFIIRPVVWPVLSLIKKILRIKKR